MALYENSILKMCKKNFRLKGNGLQKAMLFGLSALYILKCRIFIWNRSLQP